MSRPPQAEAVGRDVLLATKLHLPRTRPGFVPRPRLAGRLAHTRGVGERERMLDIYASGHLAVAEWLGGRLPAAEHALA